MILIRRKIQFPAGELELFASDQGPARHPLEETRSYAQLLATIKERATKKIFVALSFRFEAA